MRITALAVLTAALFVFFRPDKLLNPPANQKNTTITNNINKADANTASGSAEPLIKVNLPDPHQIMCQQALAYIRQTCPQ